MNYITTGEAARRCGVGINTVKRWIQKGELKCVITPGGHWRIREHEFQHFLDVHNMQPQQKDAKQSYKILLIEDDEDMCSLLEGAFELAPFNNIFKYEHDGYSGLIKVGSMQPDLLILDIMLPKINGLELIQRIRATDQCNDLRILVITGAGDRRVVRRGLEKANPDTILFKPFTVEELIAATQKLMHQNQPAQIANK